MPQHEIHGGWKIHATIEKEAKVYTCATGHVLSGDFALVHVHSSPLGMLEEILNRFNTLEKAFTWHVVGLQSSVPQSHARDDATCGAWGLQTGESQV